MHVELSGNNSFFKDSLTDHKVVMCTYRLLWRHNTHPVQINFALESCMKAIVPNRLNIVEFSGFLLALQPYPNSRGGDRQQTRLLQGSSQQSGTCNPPTLAPYTHINNTNRDHICACVVAQTQAPNFTSRSLKGPERSYPTCLQRCTPIKHTHSPPSNTHTL